MHCAEKILHQQKGWDGGGGVGTCRVTCTWWLLGLAVKVPWSRPGGPILALTSMLLSLCKRFLSGKEGCLGSEQVLGSQVCMVVKAVSRLAFSFGVRAWMKIKMQYVNSVYRLKLVSSDKNSGYTC